jgi:hypothetical protein
MSDEQSERQIRAAKNQSLFRTVNERLQGLAETFQFITEHTSFTCECADPSCIAPMLMTLGEYESIRSDPNRFAVLPDHVYFDVENIVDTTDRYVVVEKIESGASVAEELDPRTQ